MNITLGTINKDMDWNKISEKDVLEFIAYVQELQIDSQIMIYKHKDFETKQIYKNILEWAERAEEHAKIGNIKLAWKYVGRIMNISIQLREEELEIE